MNHIILRIVEAIAVCGCLSSCSYYLICLWSARTFLGERKSGRDTTLSVYSPPVSILKPLKGVDPEIYESFRSHCQQDYLEYEIIFGVSDPHDPAIAGVEQLQREFPDRAIRLVFCPEVLGANVKVSNLEQMMKTARYDLLIVNDSDILVEPTYLRRVIAPLAERSVGMVTCPYRGIAAPTFCSKLESLGISTDFFAGVLAARRLEGGIRFGFGSTLTFRRSELERIGGFRSIVEYLADDYELGRRIADLGFSIQLSDVVVETHLPAYDLQGFLSHQLRWARGVRDSRAGGYFGLISTFGLMWSLVLLVAAYTSVWALALAAATVFLRIAVAIVTGKFVLRDSQVLRYMWLLPIRDLIAVGIWIASFAGHTVKWRGDRFELRNGRLIRISE